jgi:hypothetical protein
MGLSAQNEVATPPCICASFRPFPLPDTQAQRDRGPSRPLKYCSAPIGIPHSGISSRWPTSVSREAATTLHTWVGRRYSFGRHSGR